MRSPGAIFQDQQFRSITWRKQHGLTEPDAIGKGIQLASRISYPPLLFSVCISVNKADYREVVDRSGLLKGKRRKQIGRLGRLWIKTPYNFCFHNIISMTIHNIVNKLGIHDDVVDFVFDRNEPHFDAANEMLRGLRSGLTEPLWASTLGNAIPGNDEDLIPLQAADLVAGRLKDHCSDPKNKQMIKDLLRVTGIHGSNITLHVKKARIEKLINQIVQGFPS